MIRDLLPWYEAELSFLKGEAGLFARSFPEIAASLSIQERDTENPDPHAERILQGSAFLAARIRKKLADDYPELTNSLLELLFPQQLVPIPSFTIAQFAPDPEQGRITESQVLHRGTPLESLEAVSGARCRFSTTQVVEVHAIELAEAVLESPSRRLPRMAPAGTRATSALRLKLQATGDAGFQDMGLQSLRLHLDGEPAVCQGLLYLLAHRCQHVEIEGVDAQGKPCVVGLRPGSVVPAGFAAEEGLLPLPSQAFVGFRLLQEYFAFREKFFFIDLTGLAALASQPFGTEVVVSLFFDQVPPFDQAVTRENIRLNCTPIVNVFSHSAEPILLTHRKMEHRVVPEAREGSGVEAWSVLEVTARTLDGGRSGGVRPLFSLEGTRDRDWQSVSWDQHRRTDGEGERTQVWLAVGLPEGGDRLPVPEVLSVKLLCSNGVLPTELSLGRDAQAGDFQVEDGTSHLCVFGLRRMTEPVRPDASERSHWRLLMHLALNQVSFVSDRGASLRSLLELYAPPGRRAAEAQIAAIRDVRSRTVSRFVGGCVVRGTAIEIDLDRAAFQGNGEFLFASVLDRFLAMHAALNSFTQLTVRPLDNPDDALVFRPRAGLQALA